jgi:hypothetical protein
MSACQEAHQHTLDHFPLTDDTAGYLFKTTGQKLFGLAHLLF